MTEPIITGHIHLDLTVAAGGEKAPPLTFKVVDRRVITPIFIRLQYTLTANLRVGQPRDDDGDPVLQTNYWYNLIVQADDSHTTQALTMLLSLMRGQLVYLVDSMHCADGADHTEFIKPMILSDLGDLPKDDTMLRFYYVPVMLTDASRLI